jgi:hypothetical protein
MTTPILSLPQVSSNQNQKETTINTAMAILEAAMNDAVSISLAAGTTPLALTTDQFTKFFHQKYSGQTAARQITIPNTPRWFAATNNGAYAITLKCNGSAGLTLVIGAGSRALALSDGTDIVAIGSSVNRLQDLSDVSGADSASSGQALTWNGPAGLWEPADIPNDFSTYVAGVGGASAVLAARVFVSAAAFASDFSQSQAVAGAAATAQTILTVTKNGTAVGTITFAAAATRGVFSTNVGAGSTTVSCAPGDVLAIKAPASADATLGFVAIALRGVSQ